MKDESDVSILEFFSRVRAYIDFAVQYWYFIILFVAIGAAISGWLTSKERAIYIADATFMVNDDSGAGGAAGAAALLGQFGFGTSGSEYNLDKILALAKSRAIVEEAIFSTDEEGDLLGNKIIRQYNLHKAWIENDSLRNFQFSILSRGSYTSNKAADSVYGIIVGGRKKQGLFSPDYSEESGILRFYVETFDEELSLHLANQLYRNLSSYYIREMIEKPKQNFRLLQEKNDSIVSRLAYVESQLARFQDQSYGMILKTDRMKIDRYQREVSVLNIMFGEVLKNKETAQFILKSKTPYFQEIDMPRYPLVRDEKSLLKYIVIGGVVGGFIITAILFFIFVLKKLQQEST